MGGFDGLNPEFSRRLQAMIAASGGLLGPGSGLRSIEEQIALRRKNGCPDIWQSPASSCRIPTAIPGRSNHNHGFAMDLTDASTGQAVQPGSAADREARRTARQDAFAEALADELGVDKEKVKAALEKVRTAEHEKLKADRLAALKTRLDEAVKAGKLTQAEADAIYKAAENNALGEGPGIGFGGWVGHRGPGGPGR